VPNDGAKHHEDAEPQQQDANVHRVDAAPPEGGVPKVRVNKAAWRTGALLLALATAVLFTALFAQTTVWKGHDAEQDDPLATLALVLAILAFVVQIMVYVFQTNASNAALRRAEQVNIETQGFLREIRVSSRKTLEAQDKQFERLLGFVMELVTDRQTTTPEPDSTSDADKPEPDTESESNSGSSDPAGSTVRGSGPLSEAVRRQSATTLEEFRRRFVEPPSPSRARSASEEDRRIGEYLRSYPSRDEAAEAVGVLRRLSSLATIALKRLGDVEANQRRTGRAVGLAEHIDLPGKTELIERGLAQQPLNDDTRIALTDAGRRLARIVVTRPSDVVKPEWWDEALRPLMSPPH